MSIPHITVGVDGSDGGRRALAWALRHAAITGAEVDAVTVFYYADSADPHHVPSRRAADRRREAERISKREVDAVLAAHPGAPRVTRYVVPAPAIAPALRRATAPGALLVVGSHGHGALESRLLGTVSTDCVREAGSPVVIIPTTWSEVAGEPTGQISPAPHRASQRSAAVAQA